MFADNFFYYIIDFDEILFWGLYAYFFGLAIIAIKIFEKNIEKK